MLKAIVPCLTTHVKDDWDFSRFLPSSLNFDGVLYSCGIENLYTSFPIDLGIEATDYWITRKRNWFPKWFTKKIIIDSIKFILKNNNFLFDSKMFNQVFGTAARTKCAPPYACLTIGYQEETKLFTQELPKFFSIKERELIKRYLMLIQTFYSKVHSG